MSTVSFLAQLDCKNYLPLEGFLLIYDLNDFKSRISRCILTVGSFETDFLCICFNLFVLFFLLIPHLVVAVWPCMQRIPILKKVVQFFKILKESASLELIFIKHL